MQQIREAIAQLRGFLYLRKDAPPPPRWMTLVASFYLGMMLYLAAHLSGLI